MSEEVGAKRWYLVHTYSGYENKEEFRKRVESMNMTEQILELSYLRRKKHKLKMVKPKSNLKNVPWLCTCRTSDD